MCWKFNSVWNGALNGVFFKKLILGEGRWLAVVYTDPQTCDSTPECCYASWVLGLRTCVPMPALFIKWKQRGFEPILHVTISWVFLGNVISIRVHTSVIWVGLQYTLFCNLDFPLGSFYTVTAKTLHYIDRCIVYISISLWLGNWCF